MFRIRDFGEQFVVQILFAAIYWRQVEGEFASFDGAKEAGKQYCRIIGETGKVVGTANEILPCQQSGNERRML